MIVLFDNGTEVRGKEHWGGVASSLPRVNVKTDSCTLSLLLDCLKDDFQFPDNDVVVYPSNEKKDDATTKSKEESKTLKDPQSINRHEGEAKARKSEGQSEENAATTNTRKLKLGKGEKAGIRPSKNTIYNPNTCNTEEETELKGQRVKDATNDTKTRRSKPRPLLKSIISLSGEVQLSPQTRNRKKSCGSSLEEVAAMDTGEDVPSIDEMMTCSASQDSIESTVAEVAAKNSPIEENRPEDAQDAELLVHKNGAKGGEEPSSPYLAAPVRVSIDISHVETDHEGGKPPPPSPVEQIEDALARELEPPMRKKRKRSSSTPTSTSSSGPLVVKDKLISGAANNSKQTKLDEEIVVERLPDEMENGSSSVEDAVKADVVSLNLPSHVVPCEVKHVSAAPSLVLETKPLLKEAEENHVLSHAEKEGDDCLPQLEQQSLKMLSQLTPKSQPLESSILTKKEEQEIESFPTDGMVSPITCDSDGLNEPKPLELNKSAWVKKQGALSETKNVHIKSDFNRLSTSGEDEVKTGNLGIEPEDIAPSCGVRDDSGQLQSKLTDSHEPSTLIDKAITSKGEEDLLIEPQGDVSVALKLPAPTKGEEGGGVAPPQHQRSSAEVCPWVQGNECHKWRKLPQHVQPPSVNEKWVCRGNAYDPNRQSCDVDEEERVAKGENHSVPNQLSHSTTTNTHSIPSEVNADHWVQCEAAHCHRWRRVPASINLETLPDKWFCRMNTWDPERASCEVPEEKDEQPLQPGSKPLNQMPAGRGRRLGLGTSRSTPTLPTSPPCPKPRGRPRRSSLGTGMPLNNGAASPSSPIKWVQCDEKSCKKWRCLPPGVDPKSLPEKWFCAMNADKRFASCDAPEQLEEPVKHTTSSTTPSSCGNSNASSVVEGRGGEYQGQGRSYILARQSKPNGKLSYQEIMFSANGNLKPPFGGNGVAALRMETSLYGVGEGMGKACSHAAHQSLLRTASCYPRCGTYEAEVLMRQKIRSACSSTEFNSACKILGQALQADNAPGDLNTPTIMKQEHVNSHLRMLERDGIVESNTDGGFRLTSRGVLPNSRLMNGRPLKLVKAWRR